MVPRTGHGLGVAFISTYPPRECGIGTFTRDLADNLATCPEPVVVTIAAIDGTGERYAYDPSVRVQMEERDRASYLDAARRLDGMPEVDLVCVQHDFGKFGRWEHEFTEDYLLPMLDVLQKPVVVTMHSVLPRPNALMQRTVRGMAHRADALVVMASVARDILREDYGLRGDALAKVRQIPHGVPNRVAPSSHAVCEADKRAFGLAGHRVLSTFGLLGEGKGIEYAIEAMPALIAKYPGLLYLVIGETHPEVRKLRGERYRLELQARAKQLGVEEHVRFVDRFLSQQDLLRYLAVTDVYVTPYLARDQITSGTLAYALGSGKAIVSTPYLYATEVLADGRGVLAAFRSAVSLAQAVDAVLGNPEVRVSLECRAARYGKEMAWSLVAARYQVLFRQLLDQRDACVRQWSAWAVTPAPAVDSAVAVGAARAIPPDWKQ